MKNNILKSVINSIKNIYSFKNIRKNIQFYINRIVIGSILLCYLLLIKVEVNFDAIELLKKNFILFMILLIVVILSFFIYKLRPNNKIFVNIQYAFISFCNDLISIIISTFTMFIPSLIYGIFVENYGMLTVGIFFIMIVDMLAGIQPDLNEFNIDKDKSYEFIIKCK